MKTRTIVVIAVLGIVGFMVITAYLAMRAQHNILAEFDKVNSAIDTANHSTHSYVQMVNAKAISSERRNKEIVNSKKQVHELSADMLTYIDSLKTLLQKNAADDADMAITTRLLAEGPEGKRLEIKLRVYIRDIRSVMETYPNIKMVLPMDMSLPSEEKATASWPYAFFHHVPMVAAVTVLNKFENDVKNTDVLCTRLLTAEQR